MNANELTRKYQDGERNFSTIRLHSADLSRLNLRGAVFNHADLSNCNFSNSDMTGADFSGAILDRVNFAGAILTNVNFSNAKMNNADIRNVMIDNTSFRGANLMFAHLCGNDLARADLNDAKLDWSCLVGSQMTQEQIVAVPKQAMVATVTMQQQQVSMQSGYKSALVSESGSYKMRTTEDIIGANYKFQIVEGKGKKNYC